MKEMIRVLFSLFAYLLICLFWGFSLFDRRISIKFKCACVPCVSFFHFLFLFFFFLKPGWSGRNKQDNLGKKIQTSQKLVQTVEIKLFSIRDINKWQWYSPLDWAVYVAAKPVWDMDWSEINFTRSSLEDERIGSGMSSPQYLPRFGASCLGPSKIST